MFASMTSKLTMALLEMGPKVTLVETVCEQHWEKHPLVSFAQRMMRSDNQEQFIP